MMMMTMGDDDEGYCTKIGVQCGLPAEHYYDDGEVDCGGHDEDWCPAHQIDQVSTAMEEGRPVEATL